MAYINRLIELNSNCILLVEQQLNTLNQIINMNGNIKTTNTILNNMISLTTTNNNLLTDIYNKIGYTIQGGSFVLNNDLYKETTRWFDISSYIYIVCYVLCVMCYVLLLLCLCYCYFDKIQIKIGVERLKETQLII